ncbi:MAG: 16S rRNA (cytosine(1402)-N(4))-methyltransferase RsmH, partial [Candidatus Buchananbacteria bacterium]
DFHQPVLLEEVIKYLEPKPGENFIDCTLGGSGHTEEILKLNGPSGKVLGIDLDPLAIKTAQEATKKYKNRTIFVQDNFRNLKRILKDCHFGQVDGILLDLGLSSGQLQDQGRGFSFLAEGSLDMRFGGQSNLTAEKIINTYNEKDLIEIFKNYGEERLAKPIAQRIVAKRKELAITRPEQLVEIVAEVYHKYFHNKSKTNPATKIFQALRIAVNEELDNLKLILPPAAEALKKNGRLVVISYHSLEDKMVKDFFRAESRDCLCPPAMPVCQCHHKKSLKIITPKPIEPSWEEIAANPRSRSAKMRVAQKIN